MRINKFIAERHSLSRRAVDEAISQNRIVVNGKLATRGQQVLETDTILLDGLKLELQQAQITILFNKPAGYICSRNGQGSKTIYDILPKQYHNLNPVGRLDKDSSGLLLLTNDGKLHQELTHPKYNKEKVYLVSLDKPLAQNDLKAITTKGVELEDGLSKLAILPINSTLKTLPFTYEVRMHEGRNRQIRRTFAKLNYKVIKLHRTKFGTFNINGIKDAAIQPVERLA